MACSGTEDPIVDGSGGAASTSSGGATGSGGSLTASGGSASGGSSSLSGGASGMSGGASSGGTNGDGDGESGGGSGDPAGGSDGSGGDAGGGDPVASDGCGKANPQTGSSGQPLNVSGHNYYVKLPNGYNADTPYKVMIVFPPTGNPITWSEQSAGYEQSAPDAIRVYTHMSVQSNGWQPNETNFFGPLLDKITGDYCIDETRIFAGGESSGGEFAGFVGCQYGDRLRGVVPTAPKKTSYQIDLSKQNCTGNPTAIVIYSTMDNVLNNNRAGEEFTAFYREMNGCEMSDTPVEGYTDPKSNCKMFNGCMEGSNTYHCVHQDPEYSNTYHGWPKMAGAMTWSVFDKL